MMLVSVYLNRNEENMYNLNGIQIPQINNLDYDELLDLRERLAEVLGLEDSEVELLAYNNDSDKNGKLWR